MLNRRINEIVQLTLEMKKRLINENDVETVECDDGWRGFRIQGSLTFHWQAAPSGAVFLMGRGIKR